MPKSNGRKAKHVDGEPSSNKRTTMNGGFSVVSIGEHHKCYARKHVEGQNDEGEGRTMFLVNLPVDTTERHVRSLYTQRAEAIESVRLWKGKGIDVMEDEDEEDVTSSNAPAVVPLPSTDPRDPSHFLPTSTSAHVTFLDASSLQRALDITTFAAWPDPYRRATEVKGKQDSISSNNVVEGDPPVGLAFLLARHKALRPPLDAVRAHVDSVIANFEWRLKHPSKRKVNAIEAVSMGPNGELLDEDGFTIVQATGKYGRTTEGGQTAGASVRVARSRKQANGAGRRDGEAADEPAKKKKRLELDDFYRFQRREAKRQELADLRAKFQADQEKIKQLRANRNFKPF